MHIYIYKLDVRLDLHGFPVIRTKRRSILAPLHLLSNASLSVFLENTTASFRGKLPQSVDLSGDWEVELYSITYPRTWYNLQDGNNHIYYSDDGYIF